MLQKVGALCSKSAASEIRTTLYIGHEQRTADPSHVISELKRKKPRFTMRAYGARLGVSSGVLSEMLSGGRKPTLKAAEKLALRLATARCEGLGHCSGLSLRRFRFLHLVVIPGPVRHHELVTVELENASRHFAQEVTIMAHDHHGARKIFDRFQQNFA